MTADPTGNRPAGERPGPVELVQRLWAGEASLTGRVLGAILTPAELGYRAVIRARNVAYGAGLAGASAPPVPAISVGNITVGGTGKTPMVRWLVKQLLRRGRTPGILHGGYGEDEPALHRLWFPQLPVVAERDRLRGADRAMQEGADVLVLDDAFQHRRLRRDLDIVLVAAETWSRHARLLPRGPFREPPGSLRRADIVVVTRRTASTEQAVRTEADVARISGRRTARVLLRPTGWIRPDGSLREGRPTGPVIGVAGIARTDDFFDHAEEWGAELVDAIAFPDHHPYSSAEAREIQRLADGGPIVMTAKDAVKLAPLMPQADIWVLEQAVTFESGRAWLLRAVDEVLG